MKITTIQVTAGRTFNHPHEQYSNLRPSVTMSATLDDGDDPHISIRDLQQRAEGLVEDHKKSLLNSIEELYQLTERQAEVRGLERMFVNGGAYGLEWKRIRIQVRDRDRVCQRCGKTPAQNGSALHVHHKKRLFSFTPDRLHEANDLHNLVALCRSCHKYVEFHGL